jgi:hypothetical protein
MTNQTTFMRCQGGQPQGVTGQIAFAPTFLDAQFHRAQARLKSKALRSLFRGQKAVALSFSPALTGIEPATAEDRLHEWRVKAAAMNALRIRDERLSATRRKVMRRIAANRIGDRREAA